MRMLLSRSRTRSVTFTRSNGVLPSPQIDGLDYERAMLHAKQHYVADFPAEPLHKFFRHGHCSTTAPLANLADDFHLYSCTFQEEKISQTMRHWPLKK